MIDPSSIDNQIKWATDILHNVSCSARLDSEILLAFCLQKDRSYLFTWPDQLLSKEQLACFKDLIQQRLTPQPVAYLIGSREFYSMELNTTPATLVPRPETEMLVDWVLEQIALLDHPFILDLGTGTGAIALAVKKHCPNCDMVATDFSATALEVARSNALKHHLDVRFFESDWFKSLAPDTRYDVIVSNPPYIAADDPYLSQGDLPAEPQLALTSGDSGLEDLHTIIDGARQYLKSNGVLVLEHGYDQQQAVTDLLLGAGYRSIKTHKDFNDLPRMTVARAS